MVLPVRVLDKKELSKSAKQFFTAVTQQYCRVLCCDIMVDACFLLDLADVTMLQMSLHYVADITTLCWDEIRHPAVGSVELHQPPWPSTESCVVVICLCR